MVSQGDAGASGRVVGGQNPARVGGVALERSRVRRDFSAAGGGGTEPLGGPVQK